MQERNVAATCIRNMYSVHFNVKNASNSGSLKIHANKHFAHNNLVHQQFTPRV